MSYGISILKETVPYTAISVGSIMTQSPISLTQAMGGALTMAGIVVAVLRVREASKSRRLEREKFEYQKQQDKINNGK